MFMLFFLLWLKFPGFCCVSVQSCIERQFGRAVVCGLWSAVAKAKVATVMVRVVCGLRLQTRRRQRSRLGLEKYLGVPQVRQQVESIKYPQMWVWPQVPLGGRLPSTPLHPRTPPPHQPGPPLSEHCKKSQGRVGRLEGGRGRGGKGCGLRELQWGDGDLPKVSLGRTHIWRQVESLLPRHSGVLELTWNDSQPIQSGGLCKTGGAKFCTPPHPLPWRKLACCVPRTVFCISHYVFPYFLAFFVGLFGTQKVRPF